MTDNNNNFLVACGLSALLLLFGISAAQAESPLQGGWIATSWTDAEGNTNDEPQPAIWVFTDTHYSMMIAASDEPRATYEGEDLTDAEKLVAYDTLIANSGRYTVDGNTLTTYAYVAKDPNYMSEFPENQSTYEFERDGDTLKIRSTDFGIDFATTLTRVENDSPDWID